MPDPISSAIGLGVGVIGSIGRLFGNAKANRELRALQASDPNYATSSAGIANNKLASGRLGLAQTLLNAKMPGSQTIERGIQSSQSNTVGNFRRGATDSSQFLLGAAGTEGIANDAYEKEGLMQNDYYQQNLKNLNGAQEGMINENNKGFEDDLRRYSDKVQIGGAINQNRQNSWGSLSNLGFGMADFSANGGFGGGQGSGASGGIGWNPSRQGFNNTGRATGIF